MNECKRMVAALISCLLTFTVVMWSDMSLLILSLNLKHLWWVLTELKTCLCLLLNAGALLTWCCSWTWGSSAGSWCSDGGPVLHSPHYTQGHRVLWSHRQTRHKDSNHLQTHVITPDVADRYRCTPLRRWGPAGRWSEAYRCGSTGAQRCHKGPGTTPSAYLQDTHTQMSCIKITRVFTACL